METQPRRNYEIQIVSSAAKRMRKLPRDILNRIDEAILALGFNPRPPDAKKLRGRTDRYRTRVGDYRVIYEISDANLSVLVIDVGHRKDIYRP